MQISGKRILLLGDSHTDWSPYGVQLERQLKDLGATVVRMGIGATAARTWLAGPACRTISGQRKCHSLDEARQLGPYDIAVVSLGTNDAANSSVGQGDNPAKIRAQASIAAKQIKKVADSIPASVVYWVGPPAVKDGRIKWKDPKTSMYHYYPESMEILWSEASPLFGARALDSRPATTPYLNEKWADGVHLGLEGGRAWASFVIGSIQADTADLPALPPRPAPAPAPAPAPVPAPPPPPQPPAPPPAAPPAPVVPVPVIVPALPVQRAVESEPTAPLLIPEPARASSDLALFAGVGLATMLVVVAAGLARRR
jgi:lysophospholipase L1-like esterase